MHRRLRIPTGFLLAALVVAAVAVTVAADATKPATDATALLTSLGKRYRTLSSYEFEGVVRMRVTVQDKSQDYEVPFRLVAVKPTKVRTEIQNPSISFVQVSDGQQTLVYVREAKQYTKEATPPAPTDSAGKAAAAARMAFGTPIQRYLSLEERLLSARVVGEANVSMGDRPVTCQMIEATYETPDPNRMTVSPYTYWIDRESRAIVRDSVLVRMPGPGGVPTAMTTVTVYRRARVDQPVPDSVFAFRPPSDAKLVKKIEMPGESGNQTPSPLVGKPAEDFALADLTGKQRRLSALKGKVVLIDFWATWCGPCRRELPNIAKLHKELTAKGLAIVAVNVG